MPFGDTALGAPLLDGIFLWATLFELRLLDTVFVSTLATGDSRILACVAMAMLVVTWSPADAASERARCAAAEAPPRSPSEKRAKPAHA